MLIRYPNYAVLIGWVGVIPYYKDETRVSLITVDSDSLCEQDTVGELFRVQSEVLS